MVAYEPTQSVLEPGKPVLRLDGYVLVRSKRKSFCGSPGTDLWFAPADGVGALKFVFMPDSEDEWQSSDFAERVERQFDKYRKGQQ